MLGISETRLTKQDHGRTVVFIFQMFSTAEMKSNPPLKQGNISDKWYHFCHLLLIFPRESHGKTSPGPEQLSLPLLESSLIKKTPSKLCLYEQNTLGKHQ